MKQPNLSAMDEVKAKYELYGAKDTARYIYENFDERDAVDWGFFAYRDVAKEYYIIKHDPTSQLIWNSVIFSIAGIVAGIIIAKHI